MFFQVKTTASVVNTQRLTVSDQRLRLWLTLMLNTSNQIIVQGSFSEMLTVEF